jgi:hypothetical protein
MSGFSPLGRPRPRRAPTAARSASARQPHSACSRSPSTAKRNAQKRGPSPARNHDVYQTNLPAVEGQARTHARFPGAHALARRARGDCRAPRQRPPPARGPVGDELACDVPRAALRPADAPAVAPDRRWPGGRRLQRPASLLRWQAADRSQTIRAARHFLAMTGGLACRSRNAGSSGAFRRDHRSPLRAPRGRSLARQADRSRGGAPRCAPARGALSRAHAAARCGIPVEERRAYRLHAAPLSVTAWRRALRAEAEQLLAELERRLAALPSKGGGRCLSRCCSRRSVFISICCRPGSAAAAVSGRPVPSIPARRSSGMVRPAAAG